MGGFPFCIFDVGPVQDAIRMGPVIYDALIRNFQDRPVKTTKSPKAQRRHKQGGKQTSQDSTKEQPSPDGLIVLKLVEKNQVSPSERKQRRDETNHNRTLSRALSIYFNFQFRHSES